MIGNRPIWALRLAAFGVAVSFFAFTVPVPAASAIQSLYPWQPKALRPIVELRWLGNSHPAEQDDNLDQRLHRNFGTKPEIESAFSLRAQNIVTKWGTLEVHGVAGEFHKTDAFTIDGLEAPGVFEQRTNSGLSIDFKYAAFDDALVLSSAFAWAADTYAWQDFQDAALVASERRARNGSAQRHKLDATLFDNAELKWTMSGEWNVVDEDYFANSHIRPQGFLSIAGERGMLASRLKIFCMQLAASTDSLDNRLMARNASRFTLGLDGLDLTYRQKDITRYSAITQGTVLSKKNVHSAAIEMMPNLFLPEIMSEIMDDLGAMSALVPDLVSLDLEEGDLLDTAAPSLPDALASVEVLLNWSTSLGETTALFTQETQTREIPGQSPGVESNRLIDISHTIRKGDWRIGLGVSVYEFDYTLDANPFSDSGVSGSFSLAYAPEDGPTFKLSVGRNNDRFALETDDIIERSSNLNLSLSADLSPYIREEFEQLDASLVLEYRARLTERDGGGDEDTDRNALLLSYSTRF